MREAAKCQPDRRGLPQPCRLSDEGQVSTMSGFFVVHEAEYACEFIEAEVASFSFPLAVFVFGVPVSQKDIPIFCREGCFANGTSGLRVRRRLRNFQVRDRV
jgi:hypothetical protein